MQRQMGQCLYFDSALYHLNRQCQDEIPDMKISQNNEKTRKWSLKEATVVFPVSFLNYRIK